MPPFPNICIIGLTFDLDLRPTYLNIDRDHLLIKDYLPTKFGASGAKRSWVISCTRLRDTDILTDMCNAICPSFFEGGHKYLMTNLEILATLIFGKWFWLNKKTIKNGHFELWPIWFYNPQKYMCLLIFIFYVCKEYELPGLSYLSYHITMNCWMIEKWEKLKSLNYFLSNNLKRKLWLEHVIIVTISSNILIPSVYGRAQDFPLNTHAAIWEFLKKNILKT